MPEGREATEEDDENSSLSALSRPALTVVEKIVSPAVLQPHAVSGPTEPTQSEIAVAVPPELISATATDVPPQAGSSLPKPEFGAVDTASHMPKRSRNIARLAVVNSPPSTAAATSTSFSQTAAERPDKLSGLQAGPESG